MTPRLLLLQLLFVAFSICARAADTLPYPVRTRAYSGWGTTVSGDVRTVGMAGATVGLPDTYLSATDNPAGLAMLLKDADDNLVGNSIRDSHIQSMDSPINTGSLGVAFNAYPWGVSAGYVTASREGQPYLLPGVAGQPEFNVHSREFQLGVGRVFWKNRLALGASLNFGVAEEQIDPGADAHDHAFGATLGAMIRFPRRWMLGVSYVLPLNYSFSDASASSPPPPLPGFHQPLTAPPRIGLGAGWVPNRFARFSFSVYVVGRTPGAALLRDDSATVGDKLTLQPRAGAAYDFAEYKEFHGTVFAGTYLEMTRIEGTNSRLHATAGVEIHPWVLTFGAGADISAGYQNYLFGIGFDIFKAMAKLDIIPTPYSPPYKGPFPSPLHLNEEGLPRPLVRRWKQRGPDLNPITVIRNVPARAEKKFAEIKKMIVSPEPPAEDEDGE